MPRALAAVFLLGWLFVREWCVVESITKSFHHLREQRERPSDELGATTNRTCSALQAYEFGQSFLVNGLDTSGCPREEWLTVMAATDPLKSKLFINAGLNKGYNFAIWLQVFSPSSRMNTKIWHDMACKGIEDTNIAIQCCGACNDCKENFSSPHFPFVLRPGHITMIGIDMNRNNIQKVEEIVERLNVTGVSFFTVHAAISNETGEALMPDCAFGDELCSLNGVTRVPEGTRAKISVPVMRLDDLVAEFFDRYASHWSRHHSSHGSFLKHSSSLYHPAIDILMIDVEGYDPIALQGASLLLSRQQVRVLIFEYNGGYPWTNFRLQDIVNSLDSKGYDCYFQGQSRLWRLTDCWSHFYEFHLWSNVMCILRGDAYHFALQSLVLRKPLP